MTYVAAILCALAAAFFAAGAWFWWQCLKLAPRAEQALKAQADAMVRERHAIELEQIATARLATAQALLQVVRRDRDIALAARNTGLQPVASDGQASLSREDREMLEALRGYTAVLVGNCAEHRWVILVGDDFPVEHYFPGAQKGAVQ